MGLFGLILVSNLVPICVNSCNCIHFDVISVLEAGLRMLVAILLLFDFFFIFSRCRAHHVPSSSIMAVKVTALDITAELQKQIISELEILYRV